MEDERFENQEQTEDVDFSILTGKTLESIDNRGGRIIFKTTDGDVYRQIYYDDCCASCDIEEIHGDLADLIGSPILMAEEVSSTEPDAEIIEKRKTDYTSESETWTFYKAATIKGAVTIRWYGSSNGYYSESPTFEKIITKKGEEQNEESSS